VTEAAPALSIGLAVRNRVEVVGRCIESILSQDFTDFELVISDNASDDGTERLVEEYAGADRRVRMSVNEVNIGLHENMNRVLEVSRGELFRWISSDDWLEPSCLSECVQALREHGNAIGVTTYFTVHIADRPTRSEVYRGEFPTSPDPARRFERMLRFFHGGDTRYDPIYGMYRRDALTGSHRLRRSEQTDWLLCAELALMGPIIHIDKRLSNRTRTYPGSADRAASRRRLDPVRADELKSSARRLHRDLLGLVMEADLTDNQVRRCKRALRRFSVEGAALRSQARVWEAGRRVLRR
jgi:glycosyltransferase involved in cell wall biosynthesis